MSDGINDCGPMETWSRNDKGELVQDEAHPPLVVIVRPTQQEMYVRAMKAYKLLKPARHAQLHGWEREAWAELEWCLINLKPKEAADGR
jgi:hypothetical protein